jgi:hypothetical protein
MTIGLAIAMALYLSGASLIALNSILETERRALTATDCAVIALVGAAWPVVGLTLLAFRPRRVTLLRKAAASRRR